MAKLSKPQARAHLEAEKILKQDRLTLDERIFVLENWREDATHINGLAGAFFTPEGLARDFTIEVSGPDVIDICAGIGTLAFWTALRGRATGRLVCVEINPQYAAIGRKIVPEAEWIIGDALAMDLTSIGRFTTAISNPPFGRPATRAAGVRYAFEHAIIERASHLAKFGAFIIPQASAPFEYSGRQSFTERRSESYEKFRAETGIQLTNNCGIDCDIYKSDWHGVAPSVEIVVADFTTPVPRANTSAPSRASQFELAL
jgi:predicted RNA methylase